MIRVFLKNKDGGKQRAFNVNPNATLKEMMEVIELVFLVKIENLSFKGKMLKSSQESEIIKDLGIKDKSVIQIVARLEGGQY